MRTATKAESKHRGKVINNLRTTYPLGMPAPDPLGKNFSPESRAQRKLFTQYLHEFYEASPQKLRKLVEKAHQYAIEGQARFAEMIIDRLEGPVRKDSEITTFNFNFMSDGDRQRALESVSRIRKMSEAIPVLPEEASGHTSVSEQREDSGGDKPSDDLQPDD